MKIGIASDHGGKVLKSLVDEHLREKKQVVRDFGVDIDGGSVDYPDYAEKLCRALKNGEIDRGILICGTGIGMSMAANRFPGVRATLVWNEFTVKASRQHNNSNVLCLGERVLNHTRALDLVDIWLKEEFEPRHQTRLDKIECLSSDAL